jgi:hypothetical protein
MGESRMATLLLNLRQVPEDEAEEVRALLDDHGIAYYETAPNRWGISGGAIWLRHDADADHAKRLLADYQAERERRMRAAYEERVREGTADNFLARARREPVRVTLYLAIIAGLMYVVLMPFLRLTG